jgi:hypothetical protein
VLNLLVLLPQLNLQVTLPESYLISKMNLREIGSEGGRWIELAQDRDQWRALILAALKLQVMLPERYLICKIQ